jgi:multidrug efflux pump subunit AcrA (membrane-fusion protein)
MEIVVERGPFLSVPNVSIIEEGGNRVVYVQRAAGEYLARTIHTGLEGELYTQVTDGLAEGDQVVSIGSFFVDADNKLKGGSEEP